MFGGHGGVRPQRGVAVELAATRSTLGRTGPRASVLPRRCAAPVRSSGRGMLPTRRWSSPPIGLLRCAGGGCVLVDLAPKPDPDRGIADLRDDCARRVEHWAEPAEALSIAGQYVVMKSHRTAIAVRNAGDVAVDDNTGGTSRRCCCRCCGRRSRRASRVLETIRPIVSDTAAHESAHSSGAVCRPMM